MNTTILTIETFGCPSCGYYQDFNSLDNPQKHASIFPNIPLGVCPACYTGQNDERVKRSSSLSKIVDFSNMATITSASDVELQATKKPEVDANGQPVLIQTGEREKLDIINGVPAVVTEPVMEPKLRDLTDIELTALKLQRNQSLDELEKVAVKEVNDEPALSPDEPIARS